VTPTSPALEQDESRRALRSGFAAAPHGNPKSAAPILASRILQFQATVLSADTFAEAATAFATELAVFLKFDRAAIGFTRAARTRVVATSHTAHFETGAELFQEFGAAMDEALDQASSVCFPLPNGARPLITLAHAKLAQRYGGAVCTVPLVSRNAVFGALTVVREGASTCSTEELALCEHLACIVGPILQLKDESEQSWWMRLRRSARTALRGLIEPGYATHKTLAAGAAIALVAALWVPVNYRVGAQARIESSIQRAIVAPSDGFLRQVYVRPGDRVKANQPIADIGDDDLRVERRKWESELIQHENAATGAFARSDRAQFAISQAKADEARAQLDLVESQLARARIVAPFDGIVIKGDLTQSVGAPLRRGDVLVTIAPASDFRLLIDVDERDISAIRIGQNGTVVLGALTDHTIGFEVARITAVAATREDRNVFEVEGRLRHAPALLRPGLQGVAKIDAGSQPIAWIATHRMIDWIRFTLWSVGL
jgi:biotin carboxyl carrier protein